MTLFTLTNSEQRQIGRQGGFDPALSPDGTRVAMIEDGALVLYTITASDPNGTRTVIADGPGLSGPSLGSERRPDRVHRDHERRQPDRHRRSRRRSSCRRVREHRRAADRRGGETATRLCSSRVTTSPRRRLCRSSTTTAADCAASPGRLGTPQAGNPLRVVGGSAKGRRLVVPPGLDSRPTSDRIRGAVFNMLEARFGLEDTVLADLCCGTGAMGIEALSRGAASCRFVDSSAQALAAARENLAAVGLATADATFERAEAIRWALALTADVGIDIVVADPPYGWEGWARLQTALGGKSACSSAKPTA